MPAGPGEEGGLTRRDAAGDGLKELRDEIDAVDRELVALLARRRDVVARVAEAKRRAGLPVHHPAREEDLLSDRRRRAREAGLDPDLVEDLFRRVMRSSRVSQSAAVTARGVRPGARVVVVGGAGAMGRRLRGWFEGSGYRVAVLERDDWHRAPALAGGADLAVLAVPIGATAGAARSLAPVLPRSCVLADITSVKQAPVAAMLDAHPGPVVGLHPMFGPTTRVLDRQIVVAVPGRDPDACAWVLEQFTAWGAVVVSATAAEHDEIMAVVQALRHFATFVFGQFVSRVGMDLRRTLEFSGPIYRLELGMVGRLFAQDPELYAEIIFATPERRDLLRRYLETAAGNLDLLEQGDRDAFCREFRRVADWFGDFGGQAIRESSYLIEKLVERFG